MILCVKIFLTLFVLLLAAFTHGDHLCTSSGYFPDSGGSCTTFYRCTDIYADGRLQTYQFECSPGTVFDPVYSVCNWPKAVLGCGLNPAPVESTTEHVYSEHVCTEQGIFKHLGDCHKFWLCRKKENKDKMQVS